MQNFLLLWLISFLTSLLAIFLVIKIFPKINLLDNPKKYGHKRDPVPYPAGLIIPILYFSLIFSYINPENPLFKPFLGFFLASFILLITCFLDDRYNLSPLLRIIIQIIVAIIIISFGIGIEEIRLPFSTNLNLNYGTFDFLWGSIRPLADLIAIFWIVFMINSLNWLDGISGLTSSVSGISVTVLALTAYSYGQIDISIIFSILAIICFTIFIFDLTPPKILLGDSGSMFLGLSLAVFTIIAGGKVATVMIVMFAPLFDAVWTIFRRIIKGTSPFKGDLFHLHHRLFYFLKDKKKVVSFYAFLTAISGIGSIYLETLGKTLVIILLSIFLVFLEIITSKK
jgi:UDP-GlcNAc:undecaprenyl-phosphate GlcNAc-1-phosphate transferase